MELRPRFRVRAFSIALLTALQALAAVFGVVALALPTSTDAAQSVPYLVNFQGRLTDNSGNILSDGQYNIKFRIFNAASSGTNLWEGDRVFGASDHRVTVQNGLFNIQFGDTAQGDPALSPGLFNTQTNANLYLEVELPTPATATCATNGCASFTEGAMTPRQPFAASPYAFNSDTLDGLDSGSFGQLSAIQTWTDTNTFSKTGGAAIVLSGTAAASGSILQIGSALSGGSAAGTLFGANTASTGDLINLQVSSSLRLKVDNAGALTTAGGITAGGDLSFNNGAGRTISVTNAASGAGNDLTIKAGTSGTGANNGGNLVLQAGATGGTGTSGSVIVRANGTESATAFQVQQATNAPAFTVDTTNNKVVVGDATGTNTGTSLFVIDTATADPATGYNGSMYYNSTSGTFRCYQNSAWTNCITGSITATSNSTASFVSGVQNVAASQTGLATGLLNWTSNVAVANTTAVAGGFTAPAAGSFRSCLVENNAAITAGTLSLRWRVNGVSVGSAACNMSATTNRQSATSLDSGVVTFPAGATISVALDTNAAFLPTGTNDFTVFWSVEYNSSTGNGLTMQFVYDNSSPATVTLADNKSLTVTAADTTTDPSILYNLLCTVTCGSNGRFAVQNNGVDAFAVAPNNGGISLGQSTTLAADKNLSLASGKGNISQIYANNTAGASGQSLSYSNTNTTAAGVTIQGINLTPANASAPTSGSNTLNLLNFAAGTSTGTNVTNGINFASATGYASFIDTPNFNLNSSGDITTAFTALNGTSTANGAGTNSTSLTLTSAANFDVGNYVQVNSANCGGTGVNPCYSKITAKTTNTLTITPALTWANGSTVNEYHVPEIGGIDTTQALANRFGRGYFISGVAAGNGTTYYNEDSITTSLSSFTLLNDPNLTSLTIGNTGTTLAIPGNLNVTGNITAPTTGTAGYLSRAGTTLQPTNAGDDFLTSGAIDGGAFKVGGTPGASASCSGGQMLQNPTLVNGILTGGTCATPSGTGANTNLSNLASTSVNTALVSSANNTIDLGTAGNVWKNLFISNVDAGTTTTALTVGTAATTTAITIGRSGLAVSLPGGITTSNGNINAGTGTITGNGSGLTNLAASNLSGTLPAISGANLTNLNATNLATGSAAVSVQSGGTSALTIGSASGTILLSSATTAIQKAATAFSIDVTNASNSTLTITNSGAGVGSLSVEGGIAVGSGQAYSVGASAGQSSTVSCGANQAVTTATFTGGILTTAPTCATISGTGANAALSNLAGVAINQSLVANANNSLDLGTSATAWRTGYFATSLSSPTYTGTGAVALQSGGTSALTIDSASGTLLLGSATTTLQKSSTAFSFDITNAADSTLTITNSGAGLAHLSVEGGVNIGSGQTYKINNIQISSAALSNDNAITKQGNTFNGVSQLVQTNGTGQLPALNGANLTNLNASSLTTGTGAVSLASGGSGALTLTSASGTVILGSSVLQRTAASLTLDVNNAAASTLTVTNSNASFVANLSVEGGVGIGTGQVFSIGATNGSTIAACTSSQYLASASSLGGLVTGGTCTSNDLQTAYNNSATPAAITLNTTAKDFVINASDQATDPNILFNLQCATCSANGGRFAVQDSGTDIFTVNPGGSTVIKPTAGSNLAVTLAGSSSMAITATSAPTIDQVSISNAGQPVATSGVNGLNITYVGGAPASGSEASGARIDMTPGSTNTSTWNGLRLVSTAGAGTGVSYNGIKLEGPGTPGAGTETGLNITTGWDVGVNVQSGGLQLTAMADPATSPASGSLRVYAHDVSGRTMLKALSSTGIDYTYQPSLFQQNVFLVSPGSVTPASATPILSTLGAPITMGAGTYTGTLAGSEAGGYMVNWATTTTTGTAVGFMQSSSQYYRGSVANGSNGFFAFTRFSFPDTITGYQGTTGVRFWAGLTSQTTVAGMTSSDTPTGDYAGFRISGNAAETTFRFLTRNNATTTNTNTGVTMAANKEYDLYTYVKPFSSTDATQNQTIYWRIDNLTDGTAPVEGSVTATLPTATTAMRYIFAMQNLNGTSRNLRFQRAYVETDR